jgi:phosphoribosylaminoimidazolecarboxamide formyltransferase / IMP cyclohydrolase
VLKKKKGGNYCVLQIDPTFEPALMERKVLFGLTLEQRRNDAVIDKNLFTNIVSKNKDVSVSKVLTLCKMTIQMSPAARGRHS